MTVVAEGVEDKAAMDLLVEYGCDSVQGYFLGRPCPAEDLTAWLTDSPYRKPVAERDADTPTVARGRRRAR